MIALPAIQMRIEKWILTAMRINVFALQDDMMMVATKNAHLLSLATILGFHYKILCFFSWTCTGISKDDCETCNTSAYRYLHSGGGHDKCLCSSGYYDDGSNEEC